MLTGSLKSTCFAVDSRAAKAQRSSAALAALLWDWTTSHNGERILALREELPRTETGSVQFSKTQAMSCPIDMRG